MTEPKDGPWDDATAHDDGRGFEGERLDGEDPPTMRATLADQVRLRAASRAQPAQPAPHEHVTPVALPTVTDAALRASIADRVAVVADGLDANHVRKLCQTHGLVVPIVASLDAVALTTATVVIGEPALPIPDRITYVARASLPDAAIMDLLRALVAGRTVVEPPAAAHADDPRVSELVKAIGMIGNDRAAIEKVISEAVSSIVDADRTYVLFFDPARGVLSYETALGKNEQRASAGVVAWCAYTGRAVDASPAGDDPRYLLELDDPDGKAQSRLYVEPLIGADRRTHAIIVAVRRWSRAELSDTERAALAALAARIGPAVETAITAGASSSTTSARPASTQSAIVGAAPRPAHDSRPPPVTARRAGTNPPVHMATPAEPLPVVTEPRSGPVGHPSTTASSAGASSATASQDAAPVRPARSPSMTSQPLTSSTPSQSLPSAAPSTTSPTSSQTRPPSTTQPPPATTSQNRPASTTVPPPGTTSQNRPASTTVPPPGTSSQNRAPGTTSQPPRAKRRTGEVDPIDVAVVATADDDIARVRKIAKKTRTELSVLERAEDAPPYYRIVTIGEAWAPETDTRVAYAARSAITEDQLADLLLGLSLDRAPEQLLVSDAPQSAPEAKRVQAALASARTLAQAIDLADAETRATEAIKTLLDVDRAYLSYYASETGALWSETQRRARGDDRRAIAGVAGWAARTGRAANIPRASADPRWLGPIDDPDGDMHSQLLVQPLIAPDRRVLGVLVGARRTKRAPFTDMDVVTLARFAALASPVVERLQLAQATKAFIDRTDGAPEGETRTAESSMQSLTHRVASAPRWLYAVAGALMMLGVTRLIGC